jgi:hypothetical protein
MLSFTDSNIYYQTYEQFDEVNFYRESLFQILPKSNFDLHDQYLEYLANEKVKKYVYIYAARIKEIAAKPEPWYKYKISSASWKQKLESRCFMGQK